MVPIAQVSPRLPQVIRAYDSARQLWGSSPHITTELWRWPALGKYEERECGAEAAAFGYLRERLFLNSGPEDLWLSATCAVVLNGERRPRVSKVAVEALIP